jgi:metallo-beta-lactamase class B
MTTAFIRSLRPAFAALALTAGLVPVVHGQSLSLAAIQSAERATLRNGICPEPGRAFVPEIVAPNLPPAKVFDNLYVLGDESVSAWALTTPEGIILFDAMFVGNVHETIVDGLRELGLDPNDIKFAIISHGHNDHFGGAAYLQENFGARIVMSEQDWAHMRVWPQREPLAPFPRDDIAVRDGYTVSLGGTTVDVYLTPGHSPGTLSSVFPVRDGNDTHYVGYWGASAVSFLPPEEIVEYMASADRFARIDARVDVPLTNHPYIDGSMLKLAALERRGRGDPHPFVEGNSGF